MLLRIENKKGTAYIDEKHLPILEEYFKEQFKLNEPKNCKDCGKPLISIDDGYQCDNPDCETAMKYWLQRYSRGGD